MNNLLTDFGAAYSMKGAGYETPGTNATED
jgi:hypothetical protein